MTIEKKLIKNGIARRRKFFGQCDEFTLLWKPSVTCELWVNNILATFNIYEQRKLWAQDRK